MPLHSAEDRKLLNLRCADVSALVLFATVALIVGFAFAIYTSFFYELNPKFFGTADCRILSKESITIDDAYCALKMNVTFYTFEKVQVYTNIYGTSKRCLFYYNYYCEFTALTHISNAFKIPIFCFLIL